MDEKAVQRHEHVIFNLIWPETPEETVLANMHPQKYFASIGVEFERAEPNSFQECWHLFGVTGLPDPLPRWFRIVEPPSAMLSAAGERG